MLNHSHSSFIHDFIRSRIHFCLATHTSMTSSSTCDKIAIRKWTYLSMVVFLSSSNATFHLVQTQFICAKMCSASTWDSDSKTDLVKIQKETQPMHGVCGHLQVRLRFFLHLRIGTVREVNSDCVLCLFQWDSTTRVEFGHRKKWNLYYRAMSKSWHETTFLLTHIFPFSTQGKNLPKRPSIILC